MDATPDKIWPYLVEIHKEIKWQKPEVVKLEYSKGNNRVTGSRIVGTTVIMGQLPGCQGVPIFKNLYILSPEVFRCQNPGLFFKLHLGFAIFCKILYFLIFVIDKMNDLILWLVMINKKKGTL